MADVQAHRGPDGAGMWYDADAGVGLSHRRLAILDLSERGRQPMLSRSGRFVIAFNGEVFNHAAIRSELGLRGHRFSGHSDTEVILAAAEEWGIEAAVDRFIGMFAIALWDRLERRLTLVRDRLGIKPLYYAVQKGMLAFGSELKALRQVPALDFQIDRNSAWNFIRKSYVSSSNSIYQNVFRLPPGHVLHCKVDTGLGDPCVRAYWSIDDIRPGSLKCSDGEEAAAQLEALLKDAISLRLLADVPVGLFLSGGIDSSLVCALAQSVSSRPLKTFSIGFAHGGYDEAGHARTMARHIGVDHTEAYVSEADALAVIPQLPAFYDEPFADASQIPTLLLSRMARQHVVVALSGDGGDELFGGYDRYFLARHIVAAQKWLPRTLVSAVSAAVLAAGPRILERAIAVGGPLLPGRLRKPEVGSRLLRYADCLAEEDPATLYDALTARWRHVDDPLALGASLRAQCPPFACRPADLLAGMTRADLQGWLPDDILTKLDRASMAVGLEARVPLLDHRVVEFAVGLPSELKVRNGEGKWILRRLLSRYVPAGLWRRPKHGFEVPLSQWLRGRLVRWAGGLLNPERLRREALLDPLPISRCWQQHQAGVRDWSAELWNVLMFQAWLEHNHPELARP